MENSFSSDQYYNGSTYGGYGNLGASGINEYKKVQHRPNGCSSVVDGITITSELLQNGNMHTMPPSRFKLVMSTTTQQEQGDASIKHKDVRFIDFVGVGIS
ncbi:hypothetical protein AQUCO_04600018v1 [Aquilegia coerulea]|uniref:Uncharacterized protein n=1 Tax=Aquilegia coerulea TaxID=218851 RepID=A0A2G5CLD5_AQUCA|nr:hypothetical protein AQUCO_04600018v1 [Aquilegia coerulea]